MKEKNISVEVCRSQSCWFFGKKLNQQIRDGLSGIENVPVEEGGCRGNCSTAPNVYLIEDNVYDDPKKHFTNVGRKAKTRVRSFTLEEVILEVKKEIKPDSV